MFSREEDDTVDGFCFSCGEYVRHPYGNEREVESIPKPEEKTPEDIQKELAEISGYQTVDLPKRKLRRSTLEQYGVKISMSEQDGKTPVARYYPYYKDGELTGYRVKLVDQKKTWTIGSLKGVDLFGWKEAIASGSKKLIICTGEDDAIAIRRAIELNTKTEYRDQMPFPVSIVFGDGYADKDIIRMKAKIKQYFKEVILAFDMDESGEKAATAVSKIMPEVTVAALPSNTLSV